MTNQQHFKIHLSRAGATSMSCKEAHCENYAEGWASILDPANSDHIILIKWIRDRSMRRFFELESGNALEVALRLEAIGHLTVSLALRQLLEHTPPGLIVFLFPPEQQCFIEHLDREVTFSHEQSGVRRVYTRPLDFNEHFNEESYKVKRAIERG